MSLIPVYAGVAGFALTFAILSAFGRDPYFHPDRRWVLLFSAANGVQLAVASGIGLLAYRAALFTGFLPAIFAGLAVMGAILAFWLWFNVRTFF
ncbi:MAG: hypothetical protein QXO51_07310 [Halobacteria archaeon]